MHTPPPLKQKPISGGRESRAEGTRPRSAASFGVAPPLSVRPRHARSCPHQAAHPPRLCRYGSSSVRGAPRSALMKANWSRGETGIW